MPEWAAGLRISRAAFDADVAQQMCVKLQQLLSGAVFHVSRGHDHRELHGNAGQQGQGGSRPRSSGCRQG